MPSVTVEYSRLLRPFPVKRLADALYHVTADAHGIEQAVIRLLVDTPRTPDDWTSALYALETSLESLSARCGDAMPILARMVDTADADFQRALDALVLVMRGMQATGVEQGEDVAA